MDIRTAFLNAPLDIEAEGQEPTTAVLKPPSLLLKTGHVGPKDYTTTLLKRPYVWTSSIVKVLGALRKANVEKGEIISGPSLRSS